LVGAAELLLSEKLAENNWGLKRNFLPYRHSNLVLDANHPKSIRAMSGSFPQPDPHLALVALGKNVSLALPDTDQLGLPDRYVAIHLRGGDYFKLGDAFGVLGQDYYRQALEFVDADMPLVWVSNDASHANEIVGHFGHRENTILTSASMDPFTTLSVISRGDAVIAANSSFSWWGAEIRGAVRLKIAPSNYTPKSDSNWMIHEGWTSIQASWRRT